MFLQSVYSQKTISQNKYFEKILVEQLEYGEPSFDNPYKYSKKDVEVTIPVLLLQLKNENYKINFNFNERIKLIFNLSINKKKSENYVYANFLDKCKSKDSYFINNVDNYGIYIIPQKKIISDLYPLPSLIDYQKKYPFAAKKERSIKKIYKDANGNNVEKYLWKDDPNLLELRKKNFQTIVARNKYLFNDDKSYFVWLTENDEHFMESLVKVFGYTEDLELLKWVLERNNYNDNDPQEYGRTIWTKSCDGKLNIHSNTIGLLKKKVIQKDIQSYIAYLKDDKKSELENLTKAEKEEIISVLTLLLN